MKYFVRYFCARFLYDVVRAATRRHKHPKPQPHHHGLACLSWGIVFWACAMAFVVALVR